MARAAAALRFLTLLPPLVPLALVLAAVAFAGKGRRGAAGAAAAPGFPPVVLGLVWALLGVVPVTAVAPVWSAYYYLFALCGVGARARRRGWRARSRATALVVLALLAWGSENGRRLDEFITAPGAWTSAVPREPLLRRARDLAGRSATSGSCAPLRPTLPPRSTVFFGGLPAFIGFQTGDGPLLRWAYRDSSLRSYYLMEFTRGALPPRAGVRLHRRAATRLAEMELDRDRCCSSFAVTAMISDAPAVWRSTCWSCRRRWSPTDRFAPYWRAWPRWALGDTAGARAELRPGGHDPGRGAHARDRRGDAPGGGGRHGGAPGISWREAVARHVLDPEAHACSAGCS